MSRAKMNIVRDTDKAPAAVEDDIRAEFASHVQMLEDELVALGVDLDTARVQARERFGNESRLYREVWSIKLGDRIMLQRINLALLVVLAVAVGWLVMRNSVQQQRSEAALQQVSANLEAIIKTRDAGERGVRMSPSEGPPRQVYIQGHVVRPGVYTLAEGMTLRRLIVAAGGLGNWQAQAASVVRKNPGGKEGEKIVLKDLENAAGPDVNLESDDIVTIASDEDEFPAHQGVDMCRIKGKVAMPNIFSFPPGQATLRKVLDGAGWKPADTKSVAIWNQAHPETRMSYTVEQVQSDKFAEFKLFDGDVVMVE